MKETFNIWTKIGSGELETIITAIAGVKKLDDFACDTCLPLLFGDKTNTLTILDFGCGIGRNIFEFSMYNNNWIFYGYDNENMIKKAEDYSKIKFNKSINEYNNVYLSYDWEYIKNLKFDCIYATLVFQHIFEDALTSYLNDIKKMTNKLFVGGRRFNDEYVNNKYKNTWEILEKNGFYPSNALEAGYSRDGDMHDHYFCVYQKNKNGDFC